MASGGDNISKIYQLKIFLIGISPMIWRRILIPDNSTIKDLHYILQILMGWDDYYLHQFIIRGKRFGISRWHGICFSDNPDQVCLKEFHFRINEKFIYEYNFFSKWQVQIRIEKFLPLDDRKAYPLCIGGTNQAPDEECQGPWAFMALRQKYSKWYIIHRMIDFIEGNDEDIEDEFDNFNYWLNIDKFDRRTINDRLKKYSLGFDHWEN